MKQFLIFSSLAFCIMLHAPTHAQSSRSVTTADTVLLKRLLHFRDTISYRYLIQEKHGDTVLSILKGVAFIAPRQSFAFSGSTADAIMISEKELITVLYEKKKLRIDSFSGASDSKRRLSQFQSGGNNSFMGNALTLNSIITVLPSSHKGQVKYHIVPLKKSNYKFAEVLVDIRADSLVHIHIEQENLLIPGRSADNNAVITRTFDLTELGTHPLPEIIPFYERRATLSSYCKARFAHFKIITQ